MWLVRTLFFSNFCLDVRTNERSSVTFLFFVIFGVTFFVIASYVDVIALSFLSNIAYSLSGFSRKKSVTKKTEKMNSSKRITQKVTGRKFYLSEQESPKKRLRKYWSTYFEPGQPLFSRIKFGRKPGHFMLWSDVVICTLFHASYPGTGSRNLSHITSITAILRMCKLGDTQVCDYTFGNGTSTTDEDYAGKTVLYELQSVASTGLSSLFSRASVTIFTRDRICQYTVTQLNPWME